MAINLILKTNGRLEWDSVEERVLGNKSFVTLELTILSKLFQFLWYSILINDIREGYFRPSRGIRKVFSHLGFSYI